MAPNGRRWKARRAPALTMLGMLLMVGAAAGCRLDMHQAPRYDPLQESEFFGDGRAARPLVPGTVARGHLRADDHFYTGRENGEFAETFPFEITRADVARGRERFNIYCAPCHDLAGTGNGMIVQRGFSPPPSLHTERLRNESPGHHYDVITNGFGRMPDYAEQIPPRDRWVIVAYIRALQLSQGAIAEALPGQDRERLDGAGAPDAGGEE